jgi:uncharacterized protein YrrD
MHDISFKICELEWTADVNAIVSNTGFWLGLASSRNLVQSTEMVSVDDHDVIIPRFTSHAHTVELLRSGREMKSSAPTNWIRPD